MTDVYGSDFMTIVDEDGTEFELEVLSSVEYNGSTYLAVILADGESHEGNPLDVAVLKSVEEDGENILCAVEDEQELDAVNQLIMASLYEEDEQ